MKIKTRAVSAKQMSMSTPVQLLLFASDQVDLVEPDLVCLDNWFVVFCLSQEVFFYLFGFCLGLC